MVFENSEKGEVSKLFVLFIIGFFIIFLGIIILVIVAAVFGDQSSFGAFVLIGPFPFVVGVGPEATWMVLFAIILGVLSFIMFFILRRRAKKTCI